MCAQDWHRGYNHTVVVPLNKTAAGCLDVYACGDAPFDI